MRSFWRLVCLLSAAVGVFIAVTRYRVSYHFPCRLFTYLRDGYFYFKLFSDKPLTGVFPTICGQVVWSAMKKSEKLHFTAKTGLGF
jgi:hypothetical protein